MSRRKPPSTTGEDYDARLAQARADGDQEKQSILDDVLASNRPELANSDHCSQCQLPPPADWCWEQSYACPLGFPPRNVDPRDLLRLINDLKKRVTALEATTN
jgi:hypothetical protein